MGKLKFAKSLCKLEASVQPRRIFDELYAQFLDQNNLQNVDEEVPYLRNKRLISLVDRRPTDDPSKDVPLYMYEPPESARDIPNQAVPEWYIEATTLCLLPDMEFENGKKALNLLDY